MPQLGPYNLTVQQAQRLAAAVGIAMGYRDDVTNAFRSATQQEVDEWMKSQAKSLVRNTEVSTAQAAVAEPASLVIT